jgi:hypothetical protein
MLEQQNAPYAVALDVAPWQFLPDWVASETGIALYVRQDPRPQTLNPHSNGKNTQECGGLAPFAQIRL